MLNLCVSHSRDTANNDLGAVGWSATFDGGVS